MPAVVKALRAVGVVLLQVAGGVVGFAVLITAGAYAIHGLILLIRAIP